MARKPTKKRRPVSAAVKAAADRAEARARGELIDEPKVPIDPPIKRAKRAKASAEPPTAEPKPEGRDESTGRFLPGNRFWEARSSAGPNPKFSNPDDLWKACAEYFEWVDANPLWEDRLVTFQGHATHEPAAKMRAMTLVGLCLFLDINKDTWFEWKKSRPDLSDVIARAEHVIYTQKFAGAAADLLNANIIARDLGLADKSELTGKDGGPIETVDISEIDQARRVAFALGRVLERQRAKAVTDATE